MPHRSEAMVGGHCMLATGYDMLRRGSPVILVDNSWSPQWGRNGRCEIPLAYLTDGDLADDFWLMTRIK